MKADGFHLNRIFEDDFKSLLLAQRPLIDVRSEIEFAEGHLPNAINIPILNTEERIRVGTKYKQHGQDAAVTLGHELISGEKKQARLKKWTNFIKENPMTVIYCFRGGKRSQITQAWLKEIGIDVPIIDGGYKKVRQYLISQIEELSLKVDFLLISGVTGNAKTKLLRSLKTEAQVIDLESLANHRGSAFGYKGETPTQINFENHLALDLIRQSENISVSRNNLVLLEDESRLIGPSIIPDVFFRKMRSSEVVIVQEDLQFRVNEIFQSYVADEITVQGDFLFDRFLQSLEQIQKKLGGTRYQEIKKDILFSRHEFKQNNHLHSNKIWIQKLLIYYYDPIYLESLKRRAVVKKFVGTFLECRQFLNSLF